jgi:hypothetical protein
VTKGLLSRVEMAFRATTVFRLRNHALPGEMVLQVTVIDHRGHPVAVLSWGKPPETGNSAMSSRGKTLKYDTRRHTLLRR